MKYLKTFENFNSENDNKLNTYSDTIKIKALLDNEYCKRNEIIELNNYFMASQKDKFNKEGLPMSYPIMGKGRTGGWISRKYINNCFQVL